MTPDEITRKQVLLNRLIRVRRGQTGQRAAATTRKLEQLERELNAAQAEQETATPVEITPASLALFLSFAEDAPNWSGTPLVDVTNEERGNLTQLKRAGLLTTFVSDGDTWVSFSESGIVLAAQHGHDLS